MQWMRSVTVGVVAMMLAASLARASAFDPKVVPASAKWVLHVDVDALKNASLGKLALSELEKKFEFQQLVQNISLWAGFKLPEDLHGVTLYGNAYAENAAVVMIHGTMEQSRIATFLQTISGFNSTKYGQHDVYNWQDKGKQLYGSVHASSRVVMGGSPENIQAALDLMDGKGQAMKADSTLAAGAGGLVYLAGDGLSDLKQAKNPLANQADAAWLSLREQDDKLMLRAAVTAKTAQLAEQMRASLEGIKAMLTLAASNENADPKAKAAAAALQTLTAKSQDKTLQVDGHISLDTIRNLLQNVAGNAANGNAAEPNAAQ